jgi:hypothetical protein
MLVNLLYLKTAGADGWVLLHNDLYSASCGEYTVAFQVQSTCRTEGAGGTYYSVQDGSDTKLLQFYQPNAGDYRSVSPSLVY